MHYEVAGNHSVNPTLLVGKIRRFGNFGPAYEILGLSEKKSEKGIILNIRVIDTDEFVEYPYSNAIDDPEA